MATQRRLKKSYREEIAKNRGSAVLAPQANATSAQEREASVVEHMPSDANFGSGPGDACMPAGGAEADGKTYMEFEVVPGAAAEDHLSMPSTGETVVEEPVERRSAGPPHYGIREETPMDRSKQ